MGELAGQGQPDRNWRGVVIALLVIATIFGFISAAVFLLDPDRVHKNTGEELFADGGEDAQAIIGISSDDWHASSVNRSAIPRRMRLESLYQLTAPPLETKWFNNSLLTKDGFGNVVTIEPISGTTSTIFPASALPPTDDFVLSADGEYALVTRATRRRFRYSSEFLYVIRNKQGEEFGLVSPTVASSRNDNADVTVDSASTLHVQNAVWSPTGHKIAFVYNNDVYFKAAPTDEAVRLSTTGVPDIVYNGIADWVYEEEVLEAHNALWWSSQSSFLAYASFNDTPVKNYTLVSYGNTTKQWCCDETQYPELRVLKYPKPGTPNPHAFLTVVDTRPRRVNNMPLIVMRSYVPSEFPKEDPLLCQVSWPNDTMLYAQWLNRDQNVLRAYVHDFSLSSNRNNRYTNLVLTETAGWISGHSAPHFFPAAASIPNYYLLVLPDTRTPERLNAIAQFRLQRRQLNQTPKFLTNRTNHVLDIVGYSARDYMLYYTGTGGVPRNQHLFRIKLKLPLNDVVDESSASDEECLTCSATDSSNCTFNDVSFNSDASVYVRRCSSANQVPRVELREASTNNLLKTLERFEKLEALVKQINMPTKQFFSVPLQTSGTDGQQHRWEAQVELVLPPFFNRSKNHKYPLVVSVYGGPETDYVLSQYSVGFDEYLAGAHDVVVARIDGRGSGRSGAQMAFKIYQKLGEGEVRDQLLVAQYLVNKLKFIDRNRVGIWGWSYGGYVAARALLLDSEQLLSCAVSVAPVTEWLYYDSVYTERYMRTADSQSAEAMRVYRDASVIQQPKEKLMRMGQADYLLIHGTADDNVHFMHTAMLAKKLQSFDIPFRMHIFPDQAHSIGYSTLNVYKHITSHFEQCFDLASPMDIRQELWFRNPPRLLSATTSAPPSSDILESWPPSTVANATSDAAALHPQVANAQGVLSRVDDRPVSSSTKAKERQQAKQAEQLLRDNVNRMRRRRR